MKHSKEIDHCARPAFVVVSKGLLAALALIVLRSIYMGQLVWVQAIPLSNAHAYVSVNSVSIKGHSLSMAISVPCNVCVTCIHE